MRMLVVNRDIMIRTACVIGAFAFLAAQGARAGDTALAANAVLHNFVLIGRFFPRRHGDCRRAALRPLGRRA